jgi:hypothetical protein
LKDQFELRDEKGLIVVIFITGGVFDLVVVVVAVGYASRGNARRMYKRT